MGPLWIPKELVIAAQWLPQGFPVDALWVFCGFPVYALLILYGCTMGFLWIPCKYSLLVHYGFSVDSF